MVSSGKNGLPNKQATEQVVSVFENICTQMDMHGAGNRIASYLDALRSELFTLVVIGEIKKGKTSLINSLLDMNDVLPVSSDVATSTVFRLIYGLKRKNVVVFQPDIDPKVAESLHEMSERQMADVFASASEQKNIAREIEVPDKDLALYGTEDGNPGNGKRVDHIRIEMPLERLKGLEIFDTPGLGGLIHEHSEITWRYIPRAHSVLFLLESIQTPFTRDEKFFLEKIKNIAHLVLFVQTKIDTADPSQWQAWRARNLEEISSVLGVPKDQIPYFPVSSKSKQTAIKNQSKQHYDRSGFLELESLIFGRLLGAIEKKLCFNVLDSIKQEASNKKQELSKQMEILKAETEEKLAQLETEYTRKQNAFTSFENEEFQDMITAFQDKLQDLINEGSQDLGNFLQPTQYNPVVINFIDKIRSLDDSPRELQFKIDQLSSYFTDTCVQQAVDIYEKYRQKILNLLSDTFHRFEERLQNIGVIATSESTRRNGEAETSTALAAYERAKNSLPMILPKASDLHFGRWEGFKNIITTTSFGTGVGSGVGIGLAALLVTVFPPSLVFADKIIIGCTALGGLISGWFGSKNLTHQRRQQIIHHFQQSLPNILSQLQKNLATQYQQLANEVKRQARDELRRMTSLMKRQTSDQMKEIMNVRNQEVKNKEKRKNLLAEQMQQLNNLLTSVVQSAG